MNKLGGSTEVFGGYANSAVITYLSKLDQSAADTGVDLSDLEENVAALSDLIVIVQSDIDAAEVDIVDLQQRMIDEEAISVDLLERVAINEADIEELQLLVDEGAIADLQDRMVIEEGISVDLQARMSVEEGISTVHEAEITVLQDEMTGQQNAMDTAYKRIKTIEYPLVNNITGTIPLLVGQFLLPTGTYSTKVNFGASLPADSATISIQDLSGEIINVVKAGTPEWVIADSFVLAAESEIEVWLSASSTTATAISYCIKFEVT